MVWFGTVLNAGEKLFSIHPGKVLGLKTGLEKETRDRPPRD